MPSRSKAQSRFMQAASHDPKFAKRAGIPQAVAHEFVIADAGRKLANLPQHVKKGKGKEG